MEMPKRQWQNRGLQAIRQVGQPNNKENTKAYITSRVLPMDSLTNGQWWGKRFRAMASHERITISVRIS